MNGLLLIIEKIGLAFLKQASNEATPTAIGLGLSLEGLSVAVVKIYVNSTLTKPEKIELYAVAYNGLKEDVQIAKDKGIEIAGEIPALLLESTPAFIASLI